MAAMRILRPFGASVTHVVAFMRSEERRVGKECASHTSSHMNATRPQDAILTRKLRTIRVWEVIISMVEIFEERLLDLVRQFPTPAC